jgi:hypothetical protein
MLSIGETPLSAVAAELLWAIFTEYMHRINVGGLINGRSNHHNAELVFSFRTMS